MSRDSGIRFTIPTQSQSNYDILLNLLSYGWLLEDNGHISLLPLGDNGEYNWTNLNIFEKDKALEIIKQKTVSNEITGVTLTWKGTNIGVDLIFSQDNNILFSLSVNRKSLANSEFTDVSWYLERIVPPMISSKIIIEQILWNENI